MSYFLHRPETYVCDQILSIDMLARSERFISELPQLEEMGYREIGGIKKISQVESAIAISQAHLDSLNHPMVGRVIYCSFWNDEVWTEFHCAKIHSALGLASEASVTNVRVNGATSIFIAIELAQAYITRHPESGVLITAADKIDPRFVRRKFSGGVFGDGAAATYISMKPRTEKGLWVTSIPLYETDGRFYSLDAYEDISDELREASESLQSRLLERVVKKIYRAESAVFLAQPGARFSAVDKNPVFHQFYGNWSQRGYLPASGLLHVIADFLATNVPNSECVVLGEAGVGLQYGSLIGTLKPVNTRKMEVEQ